MLGEVLGGQRRLVLFGVLLAGCACGPTDVKAPKWDPVVAAERAVGL